MFFSIDLDAFYCGVEERIDPSLKGTAFCVVQKHCVATLSYPARALGITKLSNIHEVLRKHPSIRTINGENLAKYRLAGREIFNFVQKIIGNESVERLGLEEMRFDLSGLITAWRHQLPAARDLKKLVTNDEFMDEVGGYGAQLAIGSEIIDFPNVYFQFEGATWPPNHNELVTALNLPTDPEALLNAYLAGHLAKYIQDRIWLELGYSCSIGCGPSKSLAKMVGGCHKPRMVTVLVPGYESAFVQKMPVSKVCGFGKASREAVYTQLLNQPNGNNGAKLRTGELCVGELIEVCPLPTLAEILAPVLGPDRCKALISLLEGEDRYGKTIVGYTCPQQISVEDSYAPFCSEQSWPTEIARLSEEVMAQAVIDWYNDTDRLWIKIPQSVRVSCVFANREYLRKSRSQAFHWTPTATMPEIVAQLASVAQQLLGHVSAANQARPRVINVALVI